MNPLSYWQNQSRQFPAFSKIAKEILSIPGSSVSVERVFNFGGDIIELCHHFLSPETLSSLMFGYYALKYENA